MCLALFAATGSCPSAHRRGGCSASPLSIAARPSSGTPRPTERRSRCCSRTARTCFLAGRTGWGRLDGEALEHPVGPELATAVGPAVDQHVVARAQVHRQVALDRIPLVVGADELVELVEPPRGRNRVPAAGERAPVGAALLAQRLVGLGQAALLA